MDITEVRIKLMDDPHDRLQAFCSITFDACFVIRDLKIILPPLALQREFAARVNEARAIQSAQGRSEEKIEALVQLYCVFVTLTRMMSIFDTCIIC